MLLLPLVAACQRPSPDLLLVTFDTTRADAIASYGNPLASTPAFDSLAYDGLRFEEASATAPLTLPSHASMLTGLYPDRHGIRENSGYRLPASVPSVVETLRDAGWQTGAFVAAAILDSRFGLDRGFDVYEDGFDLTETDLSPEVPRWPGDVVRGRAQEWLQRVDHERPFFVWTHFYDAHLPLRTPPEWSERVGGDDYLGAVAFEDHQLEVLLSQIQDLDRERPLAVIVSGDHGEDRGEHGEISHGWFVYRSTTRVPLLVWGDDVPQAEVRAEPVSVADIGPTLLQLAGLERTDANPYDGASLLERKPRESPLYVETWLPRLEYGYSEIRALEDGRFRLLKSGRVELYDWRADPGERHDMAKTNPGEVARMLTSFEAMEHRAGSAHPAMPDLLSGLDSLGYVSPLGDLDEEGLPDPISAPSLMLEYQAVVQSARSQSPAAGAPILREWISRHPRCGAARILLSRALALSGDFEGARETLADLMESRPDEPALVIQLSSISMAEGRLDQAESELLDVLDDRPESARAWALLGEIRRRQGRCDLAIDAANHGLALHPESSLLLLVRGACRLETGSIEDAESDLRVVLDLAPSNPDAHFVLGTVLAKLSRWDEARMEFETQRTLTPDDPLVLSGIGMCLCETGRFEEAWTIETSVLDDPRSGPDSVACALFAGAKLGKPQSELRRLERLLRNRAPDHPQLGFHGTLR